MRQGRGAVAHFNAIAGLDAYRDVRLPIMVGRPLPSDRDLLSPTAAVLAQAPEGGYRQVTRGVQIRDGTSWAVEVIEHGDCRAYSGTGTAAWSSRYPTRRSIA